MSKHTPGPWELKRPRRGTLEDWKVEAIGGQIKASAFCAADARLIAAAPLLLEVLELFVDCYPGQIEPLRGRAREIIAKIRGRD